MRFQVLETSEQLSTDRALRARQGKGTLLEQAELERQRSLGSNLQPAILGGVGLLGMKMCGGILLLWLREAVRRCCYVWAAQAQRDKTSRREKKKKKAINKLETELAGMKAQLALLEKTHKANMLQMQEKLLNKVTVPLEAHVIYWLCRWTMLW